MTQPLFACRGLSKHYGGVPVLRDVDFEVRRGEIHALLGANGAGKSTLSKLIAGLVHPTAGTMLLGGGNYRPREKREAERAGVQIVHQELNLIPTLSVAENLFFGRLPQRAGMLRRGELRRRASDLLQRFGLGWLHQDQPVAALGVGQRQLVEIAAALARDCRLLLLDEPTAALGSHEVEQLFGWLRQLQRQGVGMVFISHRLDEVARIADRTTVLRDGMRVGTWHTSEHSADAAVEAMSGESARSGHAGFVSYTREEVALEVQGLSAGIVESVSLQVRVGERLGITGLVGAGRTELLRAIFGADTATAGSVVTRRMAKPRAFRSPAEAVSAGCAMVTEDRQADGLLLSQSVLCNTSLSSIGDIFSRFGLLRRSAESTAVQEQCAALDVRCRSLSQLVRALSGGNQQKVVVARWLLRDADVLLFDEPTRGIDVAARRRIYRLLDALAAAGKAILIVSSDWEEIEETCDRVVVLARGRLTGSWQRTTWSKRAVTEASFAGETAPAVGNV